MKTRTPTALAMAFFILANLGMTNARATEPQSTPTEASPRELGPRGSSTREAKPSLDLRNPAPGRVTPAALPWRDVETCDEPARGRVVAVKEESIRGQRGVRVKAKSMSGSTLMAGIPRARESDFPVGAGFCKIDFGRH